jgi:hypothetical protein
MIRKALATASGGARVVALRKIGDNGAGQATNGVLTAAWNIRTS